MFNWPEMSRHAEDWANGFWTGAASASLMMNGRGRVCAARLSHLAQIGTTLCIGDGQFHDVPERDAYGMALEAADLTIERIGDLLPYHLAAVLGGRQSIPVATKVTE